MLSGKFLWIPYGQLVDNFQNLWIAQFACGAIVDNFESYPQDDKN